MMNAPAPMMGGAICPPVEATASTAPASALGYFRRRMSGMVKLPVVATLATALPLTMPIGQPLPGRHAYLLDADAQPTPIGVVGELLIGGELLARGYFQRADLTAERFIPDPFSTTGARLYRTGDLARFNANGQIDQRDDRIAALG